MTPLRVGVIGCGVISRHYAENARHFASFELVTCADTDPDQARALAQEHGLIATSIDGLLADPSIEIILSLTPPRVHATVIRDALAAGKHVYTEKPLSVDPADALGLVAEADRLGLRIGCAPDTFLSAPYQKAMALIDSGAIGEPLSASAAMLTGGQERWHPNPETFFADGAGPLLDMGPYYLTAMVALLGPVRRVTGFATTRTRERTIEIGARHGERFRSETPTHTAATLELRGGIVANLVASFEAAGQYVSDLQIHGTEGVLALPDPNGFAGPLRIRHGRGAAWREVPFTARGGRDSRGIGLDEMIDAMAGARPHRASGRLGAHVVEVARGILRAAELGCAVEIDSTVLHERAGSGGTR